MEISVIQEFVCRISTLSVIFIDFSATSIQCYANTETVPLQLGGWGVRGGSECQVCIITPRFHCVVCSFSSSISKVFLRYLSGEKVKGVAYVVFGVERNGEKVRLPSMKQVNNVSEILRSWQWHIDRESHPGFLCFSDRLWIFCTLTKTKVSSN